MNKVLKVILSSEGLFQSIKTLLGSVVATGISAIAIMIYSRLLGPEKFGEFSVGFSIVMILTRINDLGFNTAILKFGSERSNNDEKNFIYSFTLKYKFKISLAIMFTGILLSGFLTNLFNFSSQAIIVISMTVGLATVYYEHLLNTLQSLHRFNQAIYINIIQASVKLLWGIIMLILSISPSTLTFAWYVAAPFTPVLFWQKFVTSKTVIDFTLVNEKTKKNVFKLAKHSAVGLIAAGFIENIDILYLQKFLTTYEVGLYSGVSRIALVVSLAAYSLGNVLYPRLAKYKLKSDIKLFIKKAFLILLASIIGFLLFIPYAEFTILLTIGAEYISGLHILYILTASSFIAVASVPFIALFFSFKANWYFSISGILQLAVVLIGDTLFIPIYGLEAAAWTRVVTRLTLFTFTFITSMILYKRTYAKKT